MNSLAYSLFSDLPQVPVPEQQHFDEFDLAIMSPEDILTDSTDYLCGAGASDLASTADLTRPARVEQRISSLEKFITDSHSYPSLDTDLHGAHYLPMGNTTPPLPSQTRTIRYASPSGSQGGDGSATGSLMSDHSWMRAPNHPHSAAPSPLLDSLQFNNLLSPASFIHPMEESYCSSEYSVNPNHLQHYPDLNQQINSPVPEDAPIASFDEPMHYEHSQTQYMPPYLGHDTHFAYGSPQFEAQQDIDPFLDQPPEVKEPNEVVVEPPRKRIRRAEPQDSHPTLRREARRESSRRKNNQVTNHSKLGQSSARRGTKHGGKHLASKPPSSASRKKAGRQYPCVFAPYGCKVSFVSKNEWKRHVVSQHLQLGFYRCDVDNCKVLSSTKNSSESIALPDSTSFNPCSVNTATRPPKRFNRKDLFIQHLRRMHAPGRVPGSTTSSSKPVAPRPSKHTSDAFEASLKAVCRRCWVQQRTSPQYSQCTYCSAEFKGAGCWEARMEHVSKHCENGHAEIREDIGLREWAEREGIMWMAQDGQWELATGEKGGQRGGGMGTMVFFQN
ncbi:uncharacterized protein CIMG_01416 [Coccidioides immitis RS]|uniref:C2H2 finger domain-containing protein n=1 Tax=Coccidioides immitis (strain RS) TaxID=246410 RepID=A0A0D8JV76_COCIM|nr:uncharacterized protein CIMG_01416 [Coccidioides immitis RS]KJF60163.1 hypothetical protein CIMG_01416 [Coccidioides immitis RS]